MGLPLDVSHFNAVDVNDIRFHLEKEVDHGDDESTDEEPCQGTSTKISDGGAKKHEEGRTSPSVNVANKQIHMGEQYLNLDGCQQEFLPVAP